MLSSSKHKHSSSRSTVSLAGDRRLPLYGPLDIKNYEEFLNDGKAYFKTRSSVPFPYKLNLDNFEPLYYLGDGAFGKVILVKYKPFAKSYYAMKIIHKKALVEKQLIDYALNEKRILQGLNHPFCIRLEYFTSDKANLYFLMPFVSGGDLFGLLSKDSLNEDLAKFYSAQLVLALEFMHYCNVVHRDLKPENIIIDHVGYLKMVDFGFAKELNDSLRTYTFCGTPDYIAPEVVLAAPYSFPADWWAMGVMSYELVNGSPPFRDKDVLVTYDKIVNGKYTMPSEFSLELKDLVTRLLQTDTTKRLGNLKGGVGDIKKHKWFKDISWLDLLNRRIIPPYIPPKLGDFDTGDFPHLKRLTKSFSIDSEDTELDNYFQDF